MARILIFIFLLLNSSLQAKILPAENSKLNYRLVGFSCFENDRQDSMVNFELAIGRWTNEADFKKNILLRKVNTKGKVIIDVPYFGKEYTWRSINSQNTKSDFHHFSIVISGEADTNVTRMTILKPAEKYKDAYVFEDGANALFDMEGKAVWYLPSSGSLNPRKNGVMDLKLTPHGTVTFISANNIYETNYSGKILWKGPNTGEVSGDSTEHYHHEFTRLANGHYMALGTEFVSIDSSDFLIDHGKDDYLPWVTKDKNRGKKTPFGTLIEYDEKGKVVWSWKLSQYFLDNDKRYLNANYYDRSGPYSIIDVHANAFYFDEKTRELYLSLKNINSIFKIKYPEGDVLNICGQLGNFRVLFENKPDFCGQHSCKTTKDGALFLFNNNTCNKGELPKIMVFDQPKGNGGELQPKGKVGELQSKWEYAINLDDVVAYKEKEAKKISDTIKIAPPSVLATLGIYSKGGNIVELPDNSLFASICGAYGKAFILSPEKKILWSALLEKYNPYKNKWEDVINYKANIITDREQLEKFFWNVE